MSIQSFKAIITLTPARRPKKVATITLVRLDSIPQSQVTNLVRLNYSYRIKDINVTLKAIQTIGSRLLPPLPKEEPTLVITPSNKAEVVRAYNEQFKLKRALFQSEIFIYQEYKEKDYYKVVTNRGVTCFVYKGIHYELNYNIAPYQRDNVNKGNSSVQEPLKDIRYLIIRRVKYLTTMYNKQVRRRPIQQQQQQQQQLILSALSGITQHFYLA